MKALPFVTAAALAMALSACGDSSDSAEDRMEDTAETSAAASGPTVVALGLTEAALLDADVIDAGGMEIGNVAQVLRNPQGGVDRLLVEVEDSNPDRFVHVPVSALTPRVRGNDTDLSTSMTKADLAALPAVQLQP